jgi:predicted DNA binding CopG/RHH family protein
MAQQKKTAKAAARDDEEQTRLVIKIPERIHRQIKSRAAADGKTMAEFVLEILRAKGIS